MFDSIIKGVNEKFDLGDKAGALVSAILALMTDKRNGGFAGFIDRFRKVGLGDLADSWISSGTNTSVSYEQLESALGEDTLREISESAGTDYKTAVNASEYVIPHLIDDLTPDGEVPNENDLLSRVGTYLTGAGTLSGGVGTSSGIAGEHIDRVDAASATAAEWAEKEATAGDSGVLGGELGGRENALLSWLLPLLILAFLVVIGFWFCAGKSEPVATVNANTGTVNANTSANTTNVNVAQ